MMKRVGSSIVLGLLFPFFLLSGGAFAQGDPEAGAKMYKSLKCGKCHGDEGKGDGKVLAKMKKKSLDWTSKEVISKAGDQYLTDIIAKGGKAVGKSRLMPAYAKKMDEKAIKDMLSFIHSLAK